MGIKEGGCKATDQLQSKYGEKLDFETNGGQGRGWPDGIPFPGLSVQFGDPTETLLVFQEQRFRKATKQGESH